MIINRSVKGSTNIINKFILAAIRHKRDLSKILKNANAIINGEKIASDFGLQVRALTS